MTRPAPARPRRNGILRALAIGLIAVVVLYPHALHVIVHTAIGVGWFLLGMLIAAVFFLPGGRRPGR